MDRILAGIIVFVMSFTPLLASDLAQVESLLQDGQHDAALQMLDGLGDSATSQFLRARALAGSGQYQAAAEIYQQLIKQHPRQPEAYNNLAVIYVQQGKSVEAQKLLEKAMTSHPGFAAIYQNLSSLYVEKARTAYGKALQLSDKKPLNLKSVARLEIAANKPPAAVITGRNTSVKPALIYKADRQNTDTKQREPVAETAAAIPEGHKAAETALQSWARVWSAQDSDQYIDHYTDDFAPYGQSRDIWIEQRHVRLKKPKWINVELSNIQVMAIKDGTVRIRLHQKYQSDGYQDLSRKEFVLVEQKGSWKIAKERSLGFVTP